MRNLINVVTVGKPSVGSHTLLSIKELTLVKSPIIVPNARKALVETHCLLNIREFTLGKDPTNVGNVGKPLG